jgi:pimeloyl-ACP methyl ester carboxylesterase
MPQKGSLDWLPGALPEADVLTANLPGMHAPAVEPNDPATAAAAFARSLRAIGKGRRLVVLANSAATPVALQLCALAEVEGLVLVEPFLEPTKVWALVEIFGQLIRKDDAFLRGMADSYFGLYSGGKDYRPLQQLAPRRTCVLVGEIPLEPSRRMQGLPSFASEAERESWRASGAEVRVVPGAGHPIPEQAPEAMVAALRDVIARGS